MTEVFTDIHEREAREKMYKELPVGFQVRTQLFDKGRCMGLQVETPAGYQMDYFFGHRSYTDGFNKRIWQPALSLDLRTLTVIAELCKRCIIL